jgi:hypothetical protein
MLLGYCSLDINKFISIRDNGFNKIDIPIHKLLVIQKVNTPSIL